MPGPELESEREFRLRAALASRERRDGEADRLRRQYAPKIAALRDRLRRAEQRVEREGAQYAQRKTETAISLGATVLGALLTFSPDTCALGFSFGGAVAIRTAVIMPVSVVGVVTFATQSAGCEVAGALAEQAWLVWRRGG